MSTIQVTLSGGIEAQVTVVQNTIELTGIPIPIQGGDIHTHLNKDSVLDLLTAEHIILLNSDFSNYYNKIEDSALDISLDTSGFNNNLDNTITDVQKLAEALNNMNFIQDVIDGGTY